MKLLLKVDYMIGSNMIYNKNKKGFTLVELVVGVAIFSLVIMVVVSLFTVALRSQRKSIAIQNIQDNGRYLIGFMAKEVRMSEIRTSDGEISVLYIHHLEHGDIAYEFTGTQITRNNEPINSDEVEVQGIFYVDGGSGEDGEQPRVTIVMKVRTIGTKVEERAEINLQTTLSQRELD